jgi:DNA topoisomerase I
LPRDRGVAGHRTWFRVGSDRYTRTSRTYGVTTLTERHARVTRTRVTFTFRAEHRELVRSTVVDEEMAAALRRLLDLPGGARLFRFVDGDGVPAPLTGPLLKAYITEHLDSRVTAKGFMTLGGTLTPPSLSQRPGRRRPRRRRSA